MVPSFSDGWVYYGRARFNTIYSRGAAGVRAMKKTIIVLFHIFTLGLFLIPHALIHFILKDHA